MNIFTAGNATIISRIATPTIPTVFFSKTEAVMTVSVASENILPITGIKFPVINFAVLRVTPSVTAADAPWTEMTPRKIVKNNPNKEILPFLNNFASCVTLYCSLSTLTTLSKVARNKSGRIIDFINSPLIFIRKRMTGWKKAADTRPPDAAIKANINGINAIIKLVIVVIASIA